MSNKTKFFISILLPIIFLTGFLIVYAADTNSTYNGVDSMSQACDRKDLQGNCLYKIYLSDGNLQAYRGSITGHLEGHGGFGQSGGRGSVAGCLNNTGVIFQGICWWWLPDYQVGDGYTDVNGSNNIGSDYTSSYTAFVVQAYGADATWSPFTATVTGRKVTIASPSNNVNATEGQSFTIPWNVQWGKNVFIFYAGNGITCDVGNESGAVGTSGTATCSGSQVGTGEFTVVADGPSSSGQIHIEKTININIAGNCVANQGSSCTSAANSCGQTNTGTVNCNGSCSASAPSNSSCTAGCVPNQGSACTSPANSCGHTATGTFQCDGSCSAGVPSNSSCPACPSNPSYGQPCTSPANSCGQTAAGTFQCDGSCSAPAPSESACGHQVIGFLDTNVNNTQGNYCWLGGWTYDPDFPNSPTNIHIYKDGVPQVALTANGYRPDLQAAGYGDGNHGFNWTVPEDWKDGVNHTINVYAIDLNNNGNPNLTWSPATINCAPTNRPPSTPIISGASSGYINTDYTFTFTSTDPDGHQLKYGVDTDDGDDVPNEWSSMMPSGQSWSPVYNWSTTGAKTFKVKAQDALGLDSGWATHTITLAAGAPSGAISASNCTIASGASTCSSTVIWSTANLTGGATEVTRNNPQGTHVSFATSGNISNTVKKGPSTFFLYHNISGTPTILAEVSVSADCASGTSWNGSQCAAIPVNGVCGDVHYYCVTGTSVNNVNGTDAYTWGCNGSNGGSNASCSESKAPNECLNEADNWPVCTTIDGECINGATNPPVCTILDGACVNGAVNPPACTINASGLCLNGASNPPTCTVNNSNQCLNGFTNPPACTTAKEPIFIED